MNQHKYMEYQKNWQKENAKRISLLLNKRTDKDLIELIEVQGSGNIQGFIKSVLREYLMNKKTESVNNK